MTKEQAKSELIEVLMNQVEQLSAMSKIELGDDVIQEIQHLKSIIDQKPLNPENFEDIHEYYEMVKKQRQRQALIEMMQGDEELGLYDLSREDVELILKTCENSPEPNEALKQEIKRYKEIINDPENK